MASFHTNSPILWHQLDVQELNSTQTLNIQSQCRPYRFRLSPTWLPATSDIIQKSERPLYSVHPAVNLEISTTSSSSLVTHWTDTEIRRMLYLQWPVYYKEHNSGTAKQKRWVRRSLGLVVETLLWVHDPSGTCVCSQRQELPKRHCWRVFISWSQIPSCS